MYQTIIYAHLEKVLCAVQLFHSPFLYDITRRKIISEIWKKVWKKELSNIISKINKINIIKAKNQFGDEEIFIDVLKVNLF